jgi:hypothetical protein
MFSKVDKNTLSRGDLSGKIDYLSNSFIATPTNNHNQHQYGRPKLK